MYPIVSVHFENIFTQQQFGHFIKISSWILHNFLEAFIYFHVYTNQFTSIQNESIAFQKKVNLKTRITEKRAENDGAISEKKVIRLKLGIQSKRRFFVELPVD